MAKTKTKPIAKSKFNKNTQVKTHFSSNVLYQHNSNKQKNNFHNSSLSIQKPSKEFL